MLSPSTRSRTLFARFLHSPLFPILVVVGVLLACDAANPVDPEGNQRQVIIKPVTSQGIELTHSEGVTVQVNGEPVQYNGQSANYGYYVNLEPGTHAVVVESPGFTRSETTLTVAEDTPTSYEHFITMRGTANLHGTVVNSQTGAGVEGATLRFHRQHQGQGGGASSSAYFELTTTDTGAYHFDGAPTGFFTVFVTRSGFSDLELNDVELTGGTITLDPIAAVPPPPAGSYRIILTWGDSPRDLDSHATGPDAAGGRFHVYFGNPTFMLNGNAAVTLDLDDTDGQGPETITVNASQIPATGIYRYAVHNYSTQDASGAAGIHTSPARVQVYDATGLVKNYIAPPPTAQNQGLDADTWVVFEINVTGSGSPTFNDNGGQTLGYAQASDPGDTTVFLTGGSPVERKGATR